MSSPHKPSSPTTHTYAETALNSRFPTPRQEVFPTHASGLQKLSQCKGDPSCSETHILPTEVTAPLLPGVKAMLKEPHQHSLVPTNNYQDSPKSFLTPTKAIKRL